MVTTVDINGFRQALSPSERGHDIKVIYYHFEIHDDFSAHQQACYDL